jgi:hypothetical protein
MTVQIADTLNEVLQPKGVAVVIEGTHQRMTTRGVQSPARPWSPAACSAFAARMARPARVSEDYRSDDTRPHGQYIEVSRLRNLPTRSDCAGSLSDLQPTSFNSDKLLENEVNDHQQEDRHTQQPGYQIFSHRRLSFKLTTCFIKQRPCVQRIFSEAYRRAGATS